MLLNKKALLSIANGFLFLFLISILGCAVQQKPQGGPRDLKPPKLLKAVPADQTRNFNGKKITLEFDEFFKLTNQYQEITISPAQERSPEYTVKQKTLEIELKDTLQKNTTYVINFGKAIQDVNEGNTVKNFTYVFSTGPQIDSLSISGTVSNSLTQKKEKDVTVMLFDLKQDSLFFGKKKPALFTTTDTAGQFKFANLKANDYRIYALKESSTDKIYNNANELIAYSVKPIHLTKDSTGISLNLFKEIPDSLRLISRVFDKDGSMLMLFNKPLNKPTIRILTPPELDAQKLVEASKNSDTLSVYSKNMDFDSAQVVVSQNAIPFDTLTFRKGRRETFQRNLALSYGLVSDGAVRPGSDLTVTANIPIETINQSQIFLQEDSARVTYIINRDPQSRKRLSIKYNWKPKSKYTLTFTEGSIVDFFGDKIKKTEKKFVVDNPDNYSTLSITYTVPDTGRSYVVELLNGDQTSVLRTNQIIKNSKIIYRGLYAAKYQVRVSYDTNKNGKWDTGSLSRKTQPEGIWINPKVYTVRPKWEQEEAIDIPKEIKATE